SRAGARSGELCRRDRGVAAPGCGGRRGEARQRARGLIGVRVATWNVNGLRSRQALLAHWLAAREPDVVTLQELKQSDDQFPRAELEALGYHAVVHGEKGWNGVAILSRKPIEAVQIGLPGSDFGARFVCGRVEGLAVASVYGPNGKSMAHADFP